MLIGIISSIISDKLKIPNILLLILFGMILNHVKSQGENLIQFPAEFMTSLAFLALVMIVFDGTSKFKWRDVDTLSIRVLKLVSVFIVLNAIFLTIATFFLFRFNSSTLIYEIALALIFSFINCGTDPGAALVMLEKGRERLLKILKIESVFNTPFMVLLPFIILDLMANVSSEGIFTMLAGQLLPFLQQFVTGIGAGVLMGIVFFKFMRKRYSKNLSSLAIITAAMLTYTMAENLGGNGVLAVSTLGIFFGNFLVAQKEQIMEFSSVFAHALEILVFVFIGMIIEIPFTFDFFLRSIILFSIYLLIRFASINIVFRESDMKEKLFMTFNVSKGIAVASIVFTFIALYSDNTSILYNLSGVIPLLNLTLAFMLYSIIVSTVVVRNKDVFLNHNTKSRKGY